MVEKYVCFQNIRKKKYKINFIDGKTMLIIGVLRKIKCF